LSFAVDALSTAAGAHLPAVTRFLLETVDAASAQQVLLQVRRKIGDYLDTTRRHPSTEERTCHTLLLGIFKNCFQSQPGLLSAYCELLLSPEASLHPGSLGSAAPSPPRGRGGGGGGSGGGAGVATRGIQAVDLWILFSLAGKARPPPFSP
jgi:hypothetical protein